MHLDPFELHRPTTVDETLELAAEHAGQFDYLAGGTDLLPNYKMHLNLKPHLIALDRVEELGRFSPEHWGAMVRLADLERNPVISAQLPGIADALVEIATPLVRASGTVGGNLLLDTRCFFFNQSYFWRESLGFCLKADGDRCHVVPQKEKCYATFSGDLAPPLMVLGAEVEIAGPNGRRRIPLPTLYRPEGDGIRRHALAPGELLVAAHFPSGALGRPSAYLKLRVRPSFDFPELGVAVAGQFRNGNVGELRIAVGGVETFPKSFDQLASRFLNATLGDAEIKSLVDEVTRGLRPVHNTFLAPDYRRRMISVYLRRAIERTRQRSIGV